MKHLALNVYLRGRAAQDRLLAECVGPAVEEMRGSGLVRRFWFQPFDARGPHVGVVLGVADDAADEVRAEFSARLEAFLATHPSTEPLSDEEVARRHAECRGKRLCSIDAEPGIAAPGTFAFAEEAAPRYPFGPMPQPGADDRAGEMMCGLALWSIGHLRAGTGSRAAVRWAASVDLALRESGEAADDYWRRHASTLLVGLDERYDADPEAIVSRLRELVGDRNRDAFARAWAEVEADGPPWSSATELVEHALREGAQSPHGRWGVLREVNHCVLLQLGQMVRLHVPLVLYAWLRGSPVAAVAS
ncbi:MAG TPA: lantibiotic dehydratase C-terminal domain-containing protein [Longimicrobiaceae bacterium]|jgi:hypothetical protein|nr:lantibiotic dehydratase C-terminal domain-containing protein [Longimicrobiaceae bacterium]